MFKSLSTIPLYCVRRLFIIGTFSRTLLPRREVYSTGGFLFNLSNRFLQAFFIALFLLSRNLLYPAVVLSFLQFFLQSWFFLHFQVMSYSSTDFPHSSQIRLLFSLISILYHI